MSEPLYGCVEAGGTKFVLGVIDAERRVLARHRIATTTPGETLPAATAWLAAQSPLAAIGIACFGPVDLDRASATWGHILATTKPGWSGTDVAGVFARALSLPVGFDTDVNGAALAESRWGASAGCDVTVYLTIGTGIGGGAIVAGAPVHGFGHPEMGHARPRRHAADLDFAGVCPFHGDCYEGLASGPAIIARWGASLSELPANHIAHEIVAFYLAQLAQTLSAVLAPRKIVMGGGVMATPGLIERVRAARTDLSRGYFEGDAEDVIVAPGLGGDAGLLGALALAIGAQHGSR